jgi:DNA mismatch repair protein MSH2
VRFFDKGGDGESYVVYEADAHLAAKQVFQTNAAIKSFGGGSGGRKKTECVYLSRAHFEAFVRDLLLVKQFRVEVFVNEGNKSRIEWVVKYRVSWA